MIDIFQIEQSYFIEYLLVIQLNFHRLNQQMNRSASKQNINKSYYDLTSPLTTLQKTKQKTLLKSSFQNSFVNKVQIYNKKQKGLLNQSLKSSLKQIQNIKAGSILYKIPEFTIPEINAQISQAIKLKTTQIKQDMVNNINQIVKQVYSLPSIHQPKSSNYNPKKLQNLLGHRSEILQLQQWLRNSLVKNPPTTADQMLEYKQMIMGVGMKDLIRIINKRCLQQGKLVEQVWELTWAICKQIIIYTSLRAKKCQDLLQLQLIDLNKGYKQNLYEQQQQLIELRKKVKQYEQNQKQLNTKIQELKIENQNMSIANYKNSLQNSYCNEEFLNVLQQNLAMYLHIGDKKKRQWIKKMYSQVQKARQSIQKTFRDKVNTTMTNKIKEENIFEDNADNDLKMDQNGNFIVQSNQYIQGQRESDNQLQSIKNNLVKQFEMKDAAVGPETQQFKDTEIQYQIMFLSLQKEIQTDKVNLEQIGINTQISQENLSSQSQNKNVKPSKNKDMKNKSEKKPLLRGPSKSKIQRLSSQISELQTKQISSISSSNSLVLNKSIIAEQKQGSNTVITHQFVCKQCFCKKSQLQANKEIQYEQKQQKITKQLKQQKRYNQLQNNNTSIKSLQKLSENSNKQNDKNDQKTDKNIIVRKNQTRRKSNLSKLTAIKSFDQRENQEPSIQQDKPLIQKSQKMKLKKMLSDISQNRIIQDTEYESQRQNSSNAKFNTAGNDQENYNQYDSQQEYNRIRNKHSDSAYSSGQAKENNRKNRRRDSSILHDISYKKQTQMVTNLKQAGYNTINEDDEKNCLLAKLPLTAKQPYFKFFTQQITQANKQFISQIIFLQGNNEAILNNYFQMVQQVNSVPQNRIQMSQKQMLTTIQKNLMPIILQLLNTVKKAVLKKSVDQTIRNFQSLPFILMNKFSTKYGVKILATKNMKLLLSSLKKIQTITERYKSLRLMLFTDCRAMYSQDLFVYLLVLALVTPHLDVQRPINYEQVSQIRQICQKYLTKDKKIFEEFDLMTKQAMSLNKTQQKLGGVKLAPLLRAVITSYRMVKINRIQEIGFVFLMLKKQNYVEYQVFSFFMSCLRIQTQTKIKIVKCFLSNCDIKTKQKKMAISESGFSRFLIKCPEFSFQLLNSVVLKQKYQYDKIASNQTTKKIINTNKRMSQQSIFNKIKSPQQITSHLSLKMEQEAPQNYNHNKNNISQSRLRTEKGILLSSQHSLAKLTLNQKISEQNKQDEINQINSNFNQSYPIRNEKKHFSLKFNQEPAPQMLQKVKQYSYFTYQIAKFLQNEQQTKYMYQTQKAFVENYLIVHVMDCQIDDLIGIIDYFSNNMLEIICCDTKQLKISVNQNK